MLCVMDFFLAENAEGESRKDLKVRQTETTQRKDSILCVYLPLRSLREIIRLREINRLRKNYPLNISLEITSF
jgi:hypothetical protein